MIIRIRSVLLVFVVLIAIAPVREAVAQDSQYWSQQYGTSSRLLGGAVIGNVKDLSAGYYNPGALALNDGAKFILTAKVLQLQVLSILDTGPAGETQTIWSLTPAPSFFAGVFTLDEKRVNQVGYIYLPRQQFNARLEESRVFKKDVFPGVPGDESVAGTVLFDENMSEYWYGLMWARRLRENLGLGGSLFVAYRGQRLRQELITQAFTDSADVAQAKIIRDIDYYNWRTLLKFGVNYRSDPFRFGLSLTTPSLNLFGQGTSFVDIASSGLDTDGDGTADDFFAADVQGDSKSKFPTSWAIGAGVAYKRGATEYSVSAEWYAPIDQFQVLETAPFRAQSTGQSLLNQVAAEYKSVLNGGFGIQHRFTPHLEMYGAFTTDFSAVVKESTTTAITTWDLYHLTFGAEFSVRKIHFTTGLEWAYGSETLAGLDLSDIDGAGGLTNPGGARVRNHKITLILGLQLGGEGG